MQRYIFNHRSNPSVELVYSIYLSYYRDLIAIGNLYINPNWMLDNTIINLWNSKNYCLDLHLMAPYED